MGYCDCGEGQCRVITCAMNGSQGEYFAPSRFIEELFDKNLKLKTCNIGLTKKHL